MTIRLALETKELIDTLIYRDQGAAFRKCLREVILDVDDAYRSEPEDKFRSHFGISMSGRECARELWYKWRWVEWCPVGGRMLRLFNRGHLEEARFVAMLRMCGFTVYQADDQMKQYRVSLYGGHYGSAIDGVVLGIPEMPDVPVLAEMKTHNEKSFKKLLESGVQESKPEHFAQMQQYCGHFNLSHALYCAVNKNTDELYFEIIEYQPEVDAFFKERSHRIIFSPEIPPRLSENAGFWKCKYCDHNQVCHYSKGVEKNCRTCQNAQPQPDGTWYCREKCVKLDKAAQLAGCADWAKHSSL